MSTNLILVKEVQEKSKDGSTWLELTDENNRTHRIFRRYRIMKVTGMIYPGNMRCFEIVRTAL